MIRDDFRVLVVDLSAGRGTVERVEGRSVHVGGSGWQPSSSSATVSSISPGTIRTSRSFSPSVP